MKRSKFSLSHYHLTSMKAGYLVPIGLTEVLPGDSIQQAVSALVRVAPLARPVMHPTHVKIHSWFVPHRLVWNNWETFITGGPSNDSNPTVPYLNSPGGGFAKDSLMSYYGVRPGVDNQEVSALPARGTALIFNNFYRDQDLVNERAYSLSDGLDVTTDLTLPRPAWEKDYFTVARPWTQKGPPVTVPFVGDLKVHAPGGNGDEISVYSDEDGGYKRIYTANGGANAVVSSTTGDSDFGLYASGQDASVVDVNTVRKAFALQRYAEARARYGSRYTEYLRYLGVRSSDARLQLPEYLGGGTQTIQYSEVLQTSTGFDGEEQTGLVGDMKGHGIGAIKSNRYRRFFEEHGYIHTFMIIKPIAVYESAMERHWFKKTKEEFFQKELQHIGQQAIFKGELYSTGSSADREEWAFTDRYNEYKRSHNRVSGEFRDILDDWHMARKFESLPTLNGAFVTCNPTNRVYQSSDTDTHYCMINNSIQARRIVSKSAKSFIY